MNPNEFKCDECGGVFEKGWSDEEAYAEQENNFGDMPNEQMAIVCDDCFKEIMGKEIIQ